MEKRKPLAKSARRAGWVGSNILIGEIPEFGRIHCVRYGKEISKDTVLSSWQQTSFLRRKNFTARGWLLDVLKCVENLDKETFSLGEVYEFENALKQLYPNNQNIRPKIRQQLQVLRDNQYLDFLGGSKYRIKK